MLLSRRPNKHKRTHTQRTQTHTPFQIYVLSSDVASIIEHTNRVIYLEDDDVACFSQSGRLVLLRGAANRATDADNARQVILSMLFFSLFSLGVSRLFERTLTY